MYISDFMTVSGIELNAKVQTKQEAVERLVELLDKKGVLTNRADFIKDIEARENLGSTGISEGIAIPHAKSNAVKEAAISAITVADGVDFQSRDGKMSNILFMIAAPKDANNMHIEMLGHISIILIDTKNRDFLLSAENEEQFLSLLNRMEAKKFVGLD